MDADDLRDYADQLDIQPTSPADLGPYARFLQSMPDYLDMTQEEFTSEWLPEWESLVQTAG